MRKVLTIPELRIKMINRSLRCFYFGLLSLLPFMGLPFALAAGWLSGSARAIEKKQWNPARKLRLIGLACAIVSAVVWCWVTAIIAWQVYMGNSGRYD